VVIDSANGAHGSRVGGLCGFGGGVVIFHTG
jgi:hypothetical protein